MIDYNKINESISSNNTKKIKYVILFFIFIVALSQNLFNNIFGCEIKDFIKNVYVKHSIIILFLYLLMDVNLDEKQSVLNPLIVFLISIIIYIFFLLLMHSNKIYIMFIIILILLLIVMDKFKRHYESTINDQEILQEKLDFIYKSNNVSIIIIAICVIIGSLTSLNVKNIKNILLNKIKKC